MITNHNIIIVSGPPLKQIQDELTKHGYYQDQHYKSIISVVDWIKEQGIKMHLNEKGSWYCEDEIWWSSKARICMENNIKMLFDDKLEYEKYIIGNDPLFVHIK